MLLFAFLSQTLRILSVCQLVKMNSQANVGLVGFHNTIERYPKHREPTKLLHGRKQRCADPYLAHNYDHVVSEFNSVNNVANVQRLHCWFANPSWPTDNEYAEVIQKDRRVWRNKRELSHSKIARRGEFCEAVCGSYEQKLLEWISSSADDASGFANEVWRQVSRFAFISLIEKTSTEQKIVLWILQVCQTELAGPAIVNCLL